jgi:hypothetical protein
MTEDIIRKKINMILAQWNPLDVPDFIADEEYISYIDRIIAIGKDNVSLRIFLINTITEQMGLIFNENDKVQNKDMDNIVNKIIAIMEFD